MWKNVNINKNMIERETAKAVLIKMPKSSDYAGFVFWHPAKCVHEGRHSAAVSIGYTDDFKFKLMKYGKGKWNKYTILDEMEIDASEFEDIYSTIDENIEAKTPPHYEPETHVPDKLEVENVEVLEELKDE